MSEMTECPADWYPDPRGVHQYRYWDGDSWTQHVANDGTQSTDPMVSAQRQPSHVKADLEMTQRLSSLCGALTSQQPESRERAIQEIESIGDNAMLPLLRLLEDADLGEGASRVLAALAIRDAGFNALVSALENPEYSATWKVAGILGGAGNARAVGPLVGLLESPDRGVRREAAKSLGQLGEAEALPPLCAAIADEEAWVREGVAIALGQIGGPEAVDALVALMQDDSDQVRGEAVSSLEELADPRSVDVLCSALYDKGRYVPGRAARALGKIGDRAAVGRLCDALAVKDSDTWAQVVDALGLIGDTVAVEPLMGVLHTRSWLSHARVARALGRIGDPRAVQPLIDMLGQPCSGEEAKAVVGALVQIGDLRAVKPLIEQARRTDTVGGEDGSLFYSNPYTPASREALPAVHDWPELDDETKTAIERALDFDCLA